MIDSRKYWVERYANGGTSGAGSYGRLAHFKARILNKIVNGEGINTVVEFGCGDGAQLALYDFPLYAGLDISLPLLQKLGHKFNPKNYTFIHYPSKMVGFDLSLSIDVIYHLIEDDVYHEYMSYLFDASDKWVIIYSTNDPDIPNTAEHIKHRRFTDWVEKHRPQWRLFRVKKNDYPYKGDTRTGSRCDFYIYRKNNVNGTVL